MAGITVFRDKNSTFAPRLESEEAGSSVHGRVPPRGKTPK